MTLAEAQRSHYEQAGDRAALEEAITLGSAAVDDLPAGHVDRAQAQASLAASLLLRYRHLGEPGDLTRAIDLCESAVAATPHRHPDRGVRLCALSSALLARFELGGRDPAALRGAVTSAEAAVAATPSSHRARAQVLGALATALRHAHLLDATSTTLSRAVRACQDAVEATPVGDAQHATRLTDLALLLAEQADPGAALHTARQAAAIDAAAPHTRLRAAHALGSLAARSGDWPTAAEALRNAVDLLPLVAPRNLTRADLENRLGDLGDLAGDAAAAALHAGDPKAALESLEHGRATLLSYALDARQELAGLRQLDGELAREWERLRDQLDGVSTGTTLHPDLRARLSEEADELIHRIRALDGQRGFLSRPTLDQLSDAADQGPVINLNISGYRCDALVVTRTDLLTVPLTGLTEQGLRQKLAEFLRAIAAGRSTERAVRLDAEATVAEILGWLWDTTVGPVLAALGLTGEPDPDRPWPRVWWSPTGPLNFLPLHAAGYHGAGYHGAGYHGAGYHGAGYHGAGYHGAGYHGARYHAQGGPAAMDRVVSSYTPSIRTLLHVRRPRRTEPERRLLAIAVPADANQRLPALPAAAQEARQVNNILGGHGMLPVPTRAMVLAALPWATWVHFACHAEVDPASPSASRLLLWDGSLQVTEISALATDHAELAFLSACSTARGSADLANESIHIASAFQLAGYRHVIATLWPALDKVCLEVAEEFYREVVRRAPPSVALHETIRGLRERFPNMPSVWAGYLHSGA
ncbi:CHAT domain-containing protein [Saccharopolyspora sp. 5N708]|uniref:CHAT domain-containing protein n=1 Tax=Saccharopolyspora sp. 5N708 TaxID=3457424 RepID=UPI003FD19AE7